MEDRSRHQEPLLDRASIDFDGYSGAADDTSAASDEENPHGSLGCMKAGGFASSTYMLASISLGIGVFVQPKVLIQVGWGTGLILLIFFALVTNYTQILVIKTLDGDYSLRSFGSLAQKHLGRTGLFLSSFFTSLTCLIGNAAHLSTVVQMLHDITSWYFTGSFDYPFTRDKRAVTMIILLVVVMPFCFSRSLKNLRHIATLSVSTCTILAISLTVLAITRIAEHGLPAGEK